VGAHHRGHQRWLRNPHGSRLLSSLSGCCA
jgi:hypothetical protein